VKFRPFLEARKFAHELGLKNREQWKEFCKSGKKPSDVPNYPNDAFKNEWKSWSDWLGYENPEWVVRRVKELLRDLIKEGTIYQWDEAVLFSLLLRKGVLNLTDSNRHAQFFKNLVGASRTEEGRKVIEEYANSDSEDPPDLSKLTPVYTGQYQEQEIEKASSNELTQLVNQEEDPLDYGEIKTPEQILASTNILESINVDEEAIQFYLDYSVDELWKKALRDKKQTILAVKKKVKMETNIMIRL
jgi:hypothetical protein